MAMRRSVLGTVVGVVVAAVAGALSVVIVRGRFGASVPFFAALVASVFIGLAMSRELSGTEAEPWLSRRGRRPAHVYTVLAVAALAVTAVSWAGVPRVVPGTEAIRDAVMRAQLVEGSIGVPPIATSSGYVLAGTRGRAGLQTALSDDSSPWRWGDPGCDVIDPSRRSAMAAYATAEARDVFTGSALASATARIVSSIWFTPRTCGHVATGPPAAMVYSQCRFRSVWVVGNHASATAQCVLGTWVAGVSHQATPDNGRKLDWATVTNVVDVHDTLVRGRSGHWLVDGHAEAFAPGGGP
jgi:hypothetical protein